MANQMMQDKASEMATTLAIPTGYKQTEVGVIPEDWECKHIGELADVVRGGSPRPAGDARFFNGNFIPWLTVASLTNISLEQMYVVDTATKLTELGSLRSRVLNEDTLIISNSGATLGVAKILKIKCCANDGVAALVNQCLGNKVFLAHYINTQTKKLQEQIATGNGQPNLNTDLIRAIPVPFPREAEQAAIANVLSDTDALIAGLEQLIAKKQAIKTAAMQQLLTGRTRLPPFSKRSDGTPKGYKQSELGQIPEDWETSLLGGLADKIMVGIASAATHAYCKSGIPMLRNQNIKPNRLDSNDLLFINKEYEMAFKNKRLKAGDLLTARTGYPGTTCIIPDDFENAQSFTTLITRPTNKVNSKFLAIFMNSEVGVDFFDKNQIGGGQKNINASTLRTFIVAAANSTSKCNSRLKIRLLSEVRQKPPV
ncbi:restriction endonuclease subunit S, partial [Aeromonas rivipollensis]|uniref:restriction endonuclease subunit S n=1 Tax=Aeromonas rivipollensis TaxID=948519 RepID=UPI003D25391D